MSRCEISSDDKEENYLGQDLENKACNASESLAASLWQSPLKYVAATTGALALGGLAVALNRSGRFGLAKLTDDISQVSAASDRSATTLKFNLKEEGGREWLLERWMPAARPVSPLAESEPLFFIKSLQSPDGDIFRFSYKNQNEITSQIFADGFRKTRTLELDRYVLPHVDEGLSGIESSPIKVKSAYTELSITPQGAGNQVWRMWDRHPHDAEPIRLTGEFDSLPDLAQAKVEFMPETGKLTFSGKKINGEDIPLISLDHKVGEPLERLDISLGQYGVRDLSVKVPPLERFGKFDDLPKIVTDFLRARQAKS